MSSDYMNMFIEEARENVDELIAGLLRLETESDDLVGHTINELFRFAHNIKGMAATVGLDPITIVSHRTEDLMDGYRTTGEKPDGNTIDLLLAAADALSEMIDVVAADETPTVNQAVIDRLEKRIEEGESVPLDEPEIDEPAAVFDEIPDELAGTTRFNVALVEDCVLAGARAAIVLRSIREMATISECHPGEAEILSGKFTSFSVDVTCLIDTDSLATAIREITDVASVQVGSRAASNEPVAGDTVEEPDAAVADSSEVEPTNAQRAPAKNSQRATVRIEVERLDDLMNLVGELVIGRGQLETHVRRVGDKPLNDTVGGLTRTISDIQAAVAKARMISLEGTFRRMNRLMRDTSRELGKPLDFRMDGADTELDRSMVDEVADPLVHLLRNAIDHGVETSDERASAGKMEAGRVTLNAHYEGNQVIIEVTDDGGGIDGSKIAAKAVERGLIDADEAAGMAPDQQIQLIFLPGLSTRESASTISGRGVGMDVVRSSVAGLGGSVEVTSEIGSGSTFRIRLPLSLAVVETLLVTVSEQVWAIPLGDIDETIVVTDKDLDGVLGSPVVSLRGETLPLIHGASELALVEPPETPFPAVVFQVRGRRCALSVDQLLEQTEVVVKPAPDDLYGVDHVSGVTILGDGTVGLILDVNNLAEQYVRRERKGRLVPA